MINGSFRFWCHKVLPLVYDDSLSYYELLNKVVKYLNEMSTEVNNIVRDLNEFKVYVDTRFEDLTDNIDTLLEEKLDALVDRWKEDGTIDDIVKQSLENTAVIPSIYAGDIVIPSTHHLSACVVLSDIGMAYLLCAPTESYAQTQRSDNGILYAVDLVANAIATSYTVKCGHGNGMTYSPITEKLYITPVYTYVSGETQGCRKIYTYTLSKTTGLLDTTSLAETDTPNNNFFSVCYNRRDSEVYAIDYSYKIYVVGDDMSLTLIATAEITSTDTGVSNAPQGFAIDGAKVYVSFARGTVFEFNLNLDNMKPVITKVLQNFDVFNGRPFGEMQGLTVDKNGNIWCASQLDLNDEYKDCSLTKVCLNGIPKQYAKTPVQYSTQYSYYLNHGAYVITAGTQSRFRNSNTEMKHPAQINFMTRLWGLEKININSTADFGKLTFTVPVCIEVGANGTFKFGQINARCGRVTIDTHTGATIIVTDQYEDAVLIRCNGEFGLIGDAVEIDNLLGHDFNINVATSKPLVNLRVVPSLANGDNAVVKIANITVKTTGLYWGTEKLAIDTGE